MPSYGSDKTRDMARSVLPSRAAKSAREDKRYVHHQVRTRIRGLIAKGDWDGDADLYNLDPQRNKRYQGIKTVVRDRRDADNVGPIMRWAEAVADEMGDTPQERFIAMRSLLPPNLVGWHAMTHIDDIEAYSVEPPRWWRIDWERREKNEKAERERLIQIVKEIVHNGGRDAINIEIRRVHKTDHSADDLFVDRNNGFWERPRRCNWCAGHYLLEDNVEEFVYDLQRRAYHHPEDKEAILALG